MAETYNQRNRATSLVFLVEELRLTLDDFFNFYQSCAVELGKATIPTPLRDEITGEVTRKAISALRRRRTNDLRSMTTDIGFRARERVLLKVLDETVDLIEQRFDESALAETVDSKT